MSLPFAAFGATLDLVGGTCPFSRDGDGVQRARHRDGKLFPVRSRHLSGPTSDVEIELDQVRCCDG